MVRLQDIASNQFLLLRADQLVDQARLLLKSRIRPKRVIVRRHFGGRILYYLQKTDKLLHLLSAAQDGQTVSDALQLHEWEATSTHDVLDDAEDAPDQCVIMEQDRVVGFFDVDLHRTQTTRSGAPYSFGLESISSHDLGLGTRAHRDLSGADSNEGGDLESLTTSSTSQNPVARSVRVKFRDSVLKGQVASLLVSLSRVLNAVTGGIDIPIAAPRGTQIDIVVEPQRGFELVGMAEGQLTVTDEDESLPLQFKLKALETGSGRIRVLCFHSGQPLGAVTLSPNVVEDGTTVSPKTDDRSQSLSPLVTVQPDLTMLVQEQTLNGMPSLSFRLTASDPNEGLNLKSYGPIQLKMDPKEYFAEFFRDIEGLPIKTPAQQKIAEKKLALMGAQLFSRLLPTDLQALMWSLRDRIKSVQILSEEPWIPWELLKLQSQQDDGRTVEGLFFCEAFALTRWFMGTGRRPQLSLRNMALVIPGDSGLLGSDSERKYLNEMRTPNRNVTEIAAKFNPLVEELARGTYDAWHFTGHGKFATGDPDRSLIGLEDGEGLSPSDLVGEVANFGLAHPLVFWNACQTGNQSFSLTGIGGWARSFISPTSNPKVGAAAFIGTLWSVYDQGALDFATSFYNGILRGQSIGDSVRDARRAVKPLNDLTWLAYTVFADPAATVESGVSE